MADLQSSINGDSSLKGENALLDIEFVLDGAGPQGAYQFTSRQYGSSSKVSFSQVSTNFLNVLGVNDASVGTSGASAEGTINGEAAFGSGNILLAAIGNDAYGLNVTVKEGAPDVPYTISFSRGVTGDLENLIGTMLTSQGAIGQKETLIAGQQGSS